MLPQNSSEQSATRQTNPGRDPVLAAVPGLAPVSLPGSFVGAGAGPWAERRVLLPAAQGSTGAQTLRPSRSRPDLCAAAQN